MLDALTAKPAAQVLLCASAEQCERLAHLFPKMVAVVPNGDYSPLEGRSVIAFGADLAVLANGYASALKVITDEIPSDLTPDTALAWAKEPGRAVPYNPDSAVEAVPGAMPGAHPPADAGNDAAQTSSLSASPEAAEPDVVHITSDGVDLPYAGTLGTPTASAEPPPLWDTDQAAELLTTRPEQPEGWIPPAADFGIPADLWGHEDALPVLPAECYPDALAAYIVDEAETMGCDPGMLALYCIATCAGATTDEITLQVKAASDRWQEPARVWMMIVGDSGLTMKSPTMDMAISHAWKIEREMRVAGEQGLKDHAVEVQIFEAQKTEYVKKRAKGEPATMPAEPLPAISERLIVGNATLEAIADVLLQQGRRGALVVADELLGFIVGGMNQYKGGNGSDRTDTLELFNGGPRAVDRKGRAVLIKNWGASVMGGTQPEAIARAASVKGLETDGLLQRFTLYLPRYAIKGPDRVGDAAARRRYYDALDRLVKLCARPDLAPVRFSAEASVIVDDARDWIFQTARASWLPAGLRSHLAKWPAMFARFCLTYAAIEAADEREACIPAAISDHIAAQVWRMMQETLWPHAKHFYLTVLSGAQDMAALRQIAGLILAQGWEKISTRDMTQRSSIFRAAKVPEQRAIVSALCELGWLNPAGGKSAISGLPTKYAVNMAVHTRFAAIAESERTERAALASRWGELKEAKRARQPGE